MVFIPESRTYNERFGDNNWQDNSHDNWQERPGPSCKPWVVDDWQQELGPSWRPAARRERSRSPRAVDKHWKGSKNDSEDPTALWLWRRGIPEDQNGQEDFADQKNPNSSEARGVGPRPTSSAMCVWSPKDQDGHSDARGVGLQPTSSAICVWNPKDQRFQEDFADKENPRKKKER